MKINKWMFNEQLGERDTIPPGNDNFVIKDSKGHRWNGSLVRHKSYE